jgi:hypothetical protein
MNNSGDTGDRRARTLVYMFDQQSVVGPAIPPRHTCAPFVWKPPGLHGRGYTLCCVYNPLSPIRKSETLSST